MAETTELNFPKWKPQNATIKRISHLDIRIRYKALRNSSSAFIKTLLVREVVFGSSLNRCVKCGSTENLQVDHIISVYRTAMGEYPINMLNNIENLQCLCNKCNASKNP